MSDSQKEHSKEFQEFAKKVNLCICLDPKGGGFKKGVAICGDCGGVM